LDGSRSRHPGLSSWLAAGAADVKGPGWVAVGARHAFCRHYHLPRLDAREERPVGVVLVLNLLEELAAGRVVGGRACLCTKRLETRVGAGGPARAQSH